jgi:hypothetical protein
VGIGWNAHSAGQPVAISACMTLHKTWQDQFIDEIAPRFHETSRFAELSKQFNQNTLHRARE